jgi:hypothetical protein
MQLRLPIWLFALAGFVSVSFVFYYVTNQFTQISAMEQSTDYSPSIISKNKITNDEKSKIDNWIDLNNLNQYGDSKDTVYAGGTPLFDESTGKSTDRYIYLVKKLPEKPWDRQ